MNYSNRLATGLGKRWKRCKNKTLGVPRIVRMLDQAEDFRGLLDRRVVARQVDLALRCGLTRARVTQIMNLLKLHPAIQTYIRSLPPGSPFHLVTEKRLRTLSALSPHHQLVVACSKIPGFDQFLSRAASR